MGGSEVGASGAGICVRKTLVELIPQHGPLLVGQKPLQQAGADVAAPAVAFAGVERRENAGRRRLGAGVHAHLQGREHRPRALGDAAEQAHAAGARRDHVFVTGNLSQRPAVAEPADVADHQMGVPWVQRGEIEASAREGARPAAGDQHVGTGGEVVQPVHAAVGVEVEGQDVLAAPPQRRRRQRGERIAAGPLDEDHLGAEVCQHHGREPARRPRRQIQNP
jgi:hypothetical protein